MRIAVIGSGIAGNAAAWALSTGSDHQVIVYEEQNRPGGHSATVDIDYAGQPIAVDTGFIVYNELNYPNLTSLFCELGVSTKASDMGFSVSARDGAMEWAGKSNGVIDGLFARRRNLLSPGHFLMLRDMLRFNKMAIADHGTQALSDITLGEYLVAGRYSRKFQRDYLLPMGAAIWSMPPASLLNFPARSFIAFFNNHRLLHWKRPTWRTVDGGSRSYVEKLIAPFAQRMRLNTAVRQIVRTRSYVTVTDASGHDDQFDHVVIATHSDQALAMLGDATPAERATLGAVTYRANDVWLHRDPRLMPRRKAAWTAWNVLASSDPQAELALTYWMNALQGIDPACPLFVTLNPPEPPRDALTFGRFSYAHPQYDGGALRAQTALPALQGLNNTWFCGAWTGYGFHEDGLRSGLEAAEALGATVAWRPAIAAARAVAA
jgi:hypothetical protein